MNVLLVYPRYPDTFWSYRTILPYVSKKAAFPPLGLLTVSAMLPPEWNRRLVDVNARQLTDEQISWADMVFVSGMIVQRDSAAEIVGRCKAMGKTVVAGGPLFSTQKARVPGVDHFVLDEAEVTLPRFLKDLEEGRLEHVYSSDERPDISTTPVPDWSLIDMDDYVSMSVQYSRGCPFNCEFCDIVAMNGRRPRTKRPEQIMAEFESLYEAGWRGGVFVVDDNFIGNTAEVKNMLPRLIQWQRERDFPFQFMTEASTNLADDHELMSLMSRANFHKVFLGIETPEAESLAECGKHQNAGRDLAEAVRTIQSNGMQVMGGFIVGFDSDTERTFDAQIRFIQQAGIVTAMVGLLNVLPRTRLWKRLSAEDRLLEDSTGQNTDGFLNFVPRMEPEKLISGYKRIIERIYSRPMYYRRIHTFLKTYTPTARTHMRREDVQAFLKSLLRIGLLSKSSPHYWKLLLKTLTTNIRSLPVAVELAICGEHYVRMRDKLLRGEGEDPNAVSVTASR
ncbi:B12-binding domain-containing radical SAM protein [Desulfohalovibrio reitneri]|uniref:B12-binding domain-containing radical SAM protein n=1 Tax=Desulfohalovibrio reitneri TaxID=1307759 RepID=UPI0004A70341|nr:B12-binding domain-containing radical SAM protein [Desulfohalovibrio reitneri]